MSDIIDDFVLSYAREFDFYQRVAKICAEDCERMLLENGMRGIVTYRAKRADRLKDKLVQRELRRLEGGGTPYVNASEIREDVFDFAGVRLALYFPGDRPRVATLIEKEFVVAETRTFPTGEARDPSKRFDGYHATHHRVFLREDGLQTRRERYVGTLIEIQVASVLMHAWSEVEHDLSYKPLSGPLSEDESAILDELNGMVIAGEIALERLQRAVEKRVSEPEADFTNRYELSAFLYELWEQRRPEGSPEPEMGDVGALFWLLEETHQNRADHVSKLSSGLDTSDGARPVTEQIADVVLSEHDELVEAFRERRASSAVPIALLRRAEPSSEAEATGAFLQRWHVVERFGRLLWEAKGHGVRPRISISYRDVEPLISAQSPTRKRLQRIWGVRNELVHARRSRTGPDPISALHELNEVIASLRSSKDAAIRQAINAAIAGEDAKFASKS